MSSTGVVHTIEKIPDRERTAGRLLQAAAKTSFDPLVELDWDAPLDPDKFFCPPHRSSLYGTHLWDQLSHEQRVELTKHEVASIARLGIWFETILMQMLVRHAYDRDPGSAHVQWAYTEIADECRHSVMFARMISKFGAPAYGVGPVVHALGRFFKTVSNGSMTFVGTMYIEEILDAFQREAMADESLQPLVRGVSRIHVVEEARHIRFAAEEGTRQWAAGLNWINRAWTRFILGGIVYFGTTRLVHPQVYAAVGLDPHEAHQVAERNPHWRESRAWAARKVVAYCDELGLIGWPGKWWWNRVGLLDAPDETPATGPVRLLDRPLGVLDDLPVVAGPARFLRRRLRLAS